MKAALFDLAGKKKSDIELPVLFETTVREDISGKYFESQRAWQAYSNDSEAGKKHSASGTISHLRHSWKGHYGKGMSRIPRKTMWRRGTQFFWVGAEVSGTRGGRKSHPPKGLQSFRKVNTKESKLAMNSAFAATAHPKYISKRYSTIGVVKAAPYVIESLPSKTKDLITSLKSIYSDSFNLVLKSKQVRPGKGKSRGRRYKSNAGLLIVKSKDENNSFKGVEVRSVGDVKIQDLYPLGRLTLYTKKALTEMEKNK